MSIAVTVSLVYAGIVAESVASGLVRPSRDEEARLRYLTYQAMGALLVQFLTTPDLTPDEFVASLRESRSDTILPVLELYTEGLLTSRAMLDDYVSYLWEPPSGRADPTATAAPAPAAPSTPTPTSTPPTA